MHALFIVAEQPGLVAPEGALDRLRALLDKVPGQAGSRVMLADRTPAEQPFSADGEGPALALQINFADPAAAKAALAATSPLASLAQAAGVPAASLAHQLMEVRAFPFDAPALADPFCTFLVTYPGTTADLPAWLRHYDAHHPPIMKTFPKIREVETYWPLAFDSGLPFARSNAMQRNKVVFDSFADLIGALASPVMEDMRADGRGFAPSSAKATHFPMTTWRV